MGTMVVITMIAASLFSDLIIEVSAEITSDTVLDDDTGVIAESLPEPRNAIADMMPEAAVVRWGTVPLR